MSVVLALLRRNLRIYFRDRLGVFFSLLGALVLFVLYMLFLRSLQTSSLESSFPNATTGTISAFVDTWMFAGIIGITTITTGLGAFTIFVDDAATARFRDFVVSPIRRSQLVLGYLLSSVVVALIMSMLIFALSLLYMFFVDGLVLTVARIATVVGIVILSCTAFAALSAFAVSFVRTPGAFAALSTIVGTTLGFLAGAYVPIGLFPEGVRNLINAMPFGQTATLIRQQLSEQTVETLTHGQPEAATHLNQLFGITAAVGDWQVPTGYVVGVLLAMAVLFTTLATLRIRRRLR
jgi:multidrug/hemolysin transport system permease protein